MGWMFSQLKQRVDADRAAAAEDSLKNVDALKVIWQIPSEKPVRERAPDKASTDIYSTGTGGVPSRRSRRRS
jgi:hypothetical protein